MIYTVKFKFLEPHTEEIEAESAREAAEIFIDKYREGHLGSSMDVIDAEGKTYLFSYISLFNGAAVFEQDENADALPNQPRYDEYYERWVKPFRDR